MKFPQNPSDAQIVSGPSGSKFKYYSEFNQWIEVGKEVEVGIVSNARDGLVSPPTADVLETIRDSYLNPQFSQLKIYPNVGAYYYFLRSRDDYYKFSPENNDLRVELNRGLLVYLLQSRSCQGPKGLTGPTGKDGKVGSPGPKLPESAKIVNGNVLTSTVFVETPIETPISVELENRQDDTMILITLQLDGLWDIESNTSSILIDEENSSFDLDRDADSLEIRLIASDDWGDDWVLKVRQFGPQGRMGRDGDPFLQLREFSTGLVARQAMGGLAASNFDLFFVRTPIRSENFAVDSLTPAGGTPQFLDEVIDLEALQPSLFAAASATLDSCKRIHRYQFSPNLVDFDSLNLAVWTPDPSCLKKDQEPLTPSGNRFQWFKDVDEEDCDLPKIATAEPLPKNCCQEDFFFCPNLLEGECEIETRGPFGVPQGDFSRSSSVSVSSSGSSVSSPSGSASTPSVSISSTSASSQSSGLSSAPSSGLASAPSGSSAPSSGLASVPSSGAPSSGPVPSVPSVPSVSTVSTSTAKPSAASLSTASVASSGSTPLPSVGQPSLGSAPAASSTPAASSGGASSPSTGQPSGGGGPQNREYTPCPGFSGPNVIIPDDTGATIIEINDTCYNFLQITEEDITHQQSDQNWVTCSQCRNGQSSMMASSPQCINPVECENCCYGENSLGNMTWTTAIDCDACLDLESGSESGMPFLGTGDISGTTYAMWASGVQADTFVNAAAALTTTGTRYRLLKNCSTGQWTSNIDVLNGDLTDCVSSFDAVDGDCCGADSQSTTHRSANTASPCDGEGAATVTYEITNNPCCKTDGTCGTGTDSDCDGVCDPMPSSGGTSSPMPSSPTLEAANCTDCEALTNCAECADCTPRYWRVKLIGVDEAACSGCYEHATISDSRNFNQPVSGINGEYLLTQVAACWWQAEIPDGQITFEFTDYQTGDSTCSGTPTGTTDETQETDFQVNLFRTSSGWSLEVRSDEITYFESTIAETDNNCDSYPETMPNQGVCGLGTIGGNTLSGGGYGILAPCCLEECCDSSNCDASSLFYNFSTTGTSGCANIVRTGGGQGINTSCDGNTSPYSASGCRNAGNLPSCTYLMWWDGTSDCGDWTTDHVEVFIGGVEAGDVTSLTGIPIYATSDCSQIGTIDIDITWS